MKRRFLAVLMGVLMAAALPAAATGPFTLAGWTHRVDGADHVFDLSVENGSSSEQRLKGRLVVISVYDTSQPTVMLIDDQPIGPGDVKHIALRWSDAPVVGYVRALLVLTDSTQDTTVQSLDFWIFPTVQALVFLGIVLLSIFLVLALMRLPVMLRKWRTRVPAGMTWYVVEFDDTVVTVSSRFGVTWQDIVKANRLKPPYALRPGSRIYIPKHPLRRPADNDKTEKDL